LQQCADGSDEADCNGNPKPLTLVTLTSQIMQRPTTTSTPQYQTSRPTTQTNNIRYYSVYVFVMLTFFSSKDINTHNLRWAQQILLVKTFKTL